MIAQWPAPIRDRFLQTAALHDWGVQLLEVRRDDPHLRFCFNLLRAKWGQAPAGNRRVQSADLMAMNGEAVKTYWASIHDSALEHRLRFKTLYARRFRGKRVLDVGCGLAISPLYFAMHGAHLTFLDIVKDKVGL